MHSEKASEIENTHRNKYAPLPKGDITNVIQAFLNRTGFEFGDVKVTVDNSNPEAARIMLNGGDDVAKEMSNFGHMLKKLLQGAKSFLAMESENNSIAITVNSTHLQRHVRDQERTERRAARS